MALVGVSGGFGDLDSWVGKEASETDFWRLWCLWCEDSWVSGWAYSLCIHPSTTTPPPPSPPFPTTHTQPPRHDDSGTVIGLKCKDGLLLAVENLRLSKLLVPFSNRRTFPVGDHACIAVAGACLIKTGGTTRLLTSSSSSEPQEYPPRVSV